MWGFVKEWGEQYLSDRQAFILLTTIVFTAAALYWFGAILAPIFASLVFAYLLDSLVEWLLKKGVRRPLAIAAVFLSFLSLLIAAVLGLVPLLWHQLSDLVHNLPNIVAKLQSLANSLVERFPEYLSQSQMDDWFYSLSLELRSGAKVLLTHSLSSIPLIMKGFLYMILIPLMIFFLLKDKKPLQQWFLQFLPKERRALAEVWSEMDEQLGNYIRGKAIEMIIVGTVTYLGFVYFDLSYILLLSVINGVSVLIPYVGALLATVPIAVTALYQFGIGSDFWMILGIYALIQALDGNVLAPLLFSEACNIHPLFIIAAVLFFGGLFGFWGAFFAIPLATLVRAVITAWPKIEAR